MFERASRALGFVLRDDVRGMTKLSIDDISAMSLSLMALGLQPTMPGAEPPAELIHVPKPETTNVAV